MLWLHLLGGRQRATRTLSSLVVMASSLFLPCIWMLHPLQRRRNLGCHRVKSLEKRYLSEVLLCRSRGAGPSSRTASLSLLILSWRRDERLRRCRSWFVPVPTEILTWTIKRLAASANDASSLPCCCTRRSRQRCTCLLVIALSPANTSTMWGLS